MDLVQRAYLHEAYGAMGTLVIAVVLTSAWFVTGQFSSSGVPSVLQGMSIPLPKAVKSVSTKELETLSKRVENLNNETKEVLKNITKEIDEIKTLMTSLDAMSGSVVKTTGQGAVSSVDQAQIDSLITKVDAAAAEITALKGSLEKVKSESSAKVAAMEQSVQTIKNKLDTEIDSVTTKVDMTTAEITTLKDNVETVQAAAAESSHIVAAIKQTIQKVEGKMDTQIDSVATKVDMATVEITTLKGSVETVKAGATKSNAKVASVEHSVQGIESKVNSEIDSVTTKVDMANAEILTLKGSLKTVQTETEDAKARVADVQQSVESVGSKVDTEIDSMKASIDPTTAAVKDLKGILDTVQVEADETKAKVATIEKSVQMADARLDTTKDEMAKSLDEVKGKVTQIKKEVEEQQEKVLKQCLNTEHQNAVILDTIPFSIKLDRLAFQFANGSTRNQEAAKAIDRNRSPNFRDGSCTSTDLDDITPWWQGKLTDESEVHRIIITNRGDCCPERLRYFKIECFDEDPIQTKDAKPTLCREVDTVQELAMPTIACVRPITAKYIRITKKNKEQLTLCEVDIEGLTLPKRPQGLAIQSSTASASSGAMLATDKEPTTCSETQSEAGRHSWWQVDLTAKVYVSTVSISSKEADILTWLSNIEIRLYYTLPPSCSEAPSYVCSSDSPVIKGEVVTLTCDSPVEGRYMRIAKKDEGPLSICEVSFTTV